MKTFLLPGMAAVVLFLGQRVAANPIVNWAYYPTTPVYVGETVDFGLQPAVPDPGDYFTAGIVAWDFGDNTGTIYDGLDETHIYTAPGLYGVTVDVVGIEAGPNAPGFFVTDLPIIAVYADPSVPDSNSSAALLAVAVVGLGCCGSLLCGRPRVP